MKMSEPLIALIKLIYLVKEGVPKGDPPLCPLCLCG